MSYAFFIKGFNVMKKLLSLFVSLLIALSSFSYEVLAEENVNVVLDGKTITFDVPAQIINGRTMVPMRKIFEELGMVVEWFDETQTVIAAKQGVVVEFPIGSTTVFRNTIKQIIDVPAQLVDNRTLVPVRFVSEFTGAEVVWDESTNTAFINSKDNIKQLYWNDTYEYWGEIEDEDASGYGALYDKEDGSLRQIGKYINSKIVEGSDFFDDGATFNGNYENGKFAYGLLCFSNGDSFIGEFKDGGMSNGTYKFSNGEYYTGEFDANEKFSDGTRYYLNGDSYSGQFKNGSINGKGTYNYANGSFYTGEWQNGKPNGYGVFYEFVEDVKYSGNYINGKRDGDFVIEDLYLNQTYYVTYDNGVYVDKNYIQLQNEKKYKEEHDVLISWAKEKTNEIYAKGDEIYNQILNKVSTSMEYDSNLDSFAAANAKRQQAALIEQYKKTAETAKIKYIAEQLELLADVVQQQEKALKMKYNIK